MKLTHRVDTYAERVHDQDIVAGPLVRLACDRHLKERRQAAKKSGHPLGMFFHEAAANHIIEFFEGVLRLPDTLDEHGDPIQFLLTPANTFIVGSLFGWKMADGWRRYRDGYVEEGKGNSKTPLAAGIGLYGMTMDGEQAAEIYSVATGIDQARICWLDADRMVEASPELLQLIHRSKDNLAYAGTYSWFRPLSKEKRGKSGPRPHMVFFDEMHEYADAVNVNKMRAGMKRRKQPLALGITNSGYDRTSVCFQHHEHARKMLEGVIEDQRTFAYVCSLDKDDDPLKNEACWPKANPNLGIIIQPDYLRRQVENARNIPGETNTVLRLNFCVWTSQHTPAWDMAKWREAGRLRFTEADLVGCPCYGGLDLGQSDDFAAWVLMWDLPEFVAIRARFWLPQSALDKYPDRPYAEWQRVEVPGLGSLPAHPLLEVTEGDTTDIDLIEEAIIADAREAGCVEIAYDKRFAQQLALHLQGVGLTMVDTPQGFALNEAIQGTAGGVATLVRNVELAHGDNLIMTWMMDNTVLRHGRNKEVRIDKDAAKEKIDGPSALVMANSRRIAQPTSDGDELSGILVI